MSNSYLNKLRQKSDTRKKQIAFGASLLITVLIAGTWYLTSEATSGTFSVNNSADSSAAAAALNPDSQTPTSAVDSLRQQFGSNDGYTDAETQQMINDEEQTVNDNPNTNSSMDSNTDDTDNTNSNGVIISDPSGAPQQTQGYSQDNNVIISNSNQNSQD